MAAGLFGAAVAGVGILRQQVRGQASEGALLRLLAICIGGYGSVWSARCLGANSLGISSFVIASVAQITLVGRVCPDQVLVRKLRATDEQDQSNLISAVLCGRVVAALLLSIIAFAITAIINGTEVHLVAAAIGAVLVVLTSASMEWVLQAQGRIREMYRIQAAGTVLAAALYTVCFSEGQVAGSDLVVQVAAMLATTILLWRASRVRLRHLKIGDCMRRFVTTAREGRVAYLSGFVVFAYNSMEVTLIGWLLGMTAVGYYRTALIIANVVASVLAVIPQVLYVRFLDLKGDYELLKRLQKKAFVMSSIAIAVLSPFVFGLSPIVHGVAFGDEYRPAVASVIVLIFGKLLSLQAGIFTWALWATENESDILAISILVGVCSIVLNMILLPKYGVTAAAVVSLSSEALMCAFAYFRCNTRFSRAHEAILHPRAKI